MGGKCRAIWKAQSLRSFPFQIAFVSTEGWRSDDFIIVGGVFMEGIGMTARVSAFARAMHARNRDQVYLDPLAEKLLSPAEMQEIATSM